MINFDYDKLIILKYLFGGGGVFLQSCLGLSDDVVFKQKDLAQMQLDGKLSVEKKLKYLLLATKQQSERQIWGDWGFRRGFWNIKDTDYSLYGKEYISRKFAPIVHKCIDNNKFIFQTVHEDKLLISMLRYWKNSKVIIFKNEQKFASTRALGDVGHAPKRIRTSTDPAKTRIDSKSYFINPDILKLNITEKYFWCSITKLQLDQSQINNLSYEWDCDWYFSRDKTIDEIEKLYDLLGLSGFNLKVISEFYEAWRNAIKF